MPKHLDAYVTIQISHQVVKPSLTSTALTSTACIHARTFACRVHAFQNLQERLVLAGFACLGHFVIFKLGSSACIEIAKQVTE
jgi:hypothetical protein